MAELFLIVLSFYYMKSCDTGHLRSDKDKFIENERVNTEVKEHRRE